MIDISTERLITFTAAARVRPPSRAGRPTHVATVHRWRLRGLRGVRLEAVRLGGVWYTSYEALQRFAARLAGETDGGPAATGTASAVPGRAIDAALDRLGI